MAAHPRHRSSVVVLLVCAGLVLTGTSCRPPAPAVPSTWVAYYGMDAQPENLAAYDVVVIDPNYPGELAVLKANKAQVLGYISLGELNDQRPQFAAAKEQGLLLHENPNWKGAWLADIRKPGWQRLIVDEMAATLVARGFDGLFLDTLDSPLHLETTDSVRYAGMQKAAESLLAQLHAKFPHARLLMNGAVQLLGPCRQAVQWVAIESSLTTWNFESKSARWRTADERAWALNRLRQAAVENQQLRVFTLDYWPTVDVKAVGEIYRVQRATGFVPYVATIALDKVVAEPVAVTPITATPVSH